MIKTKIINYLKIIIQSFLKVKKNHGKIKISDVIDSFGMIELIIFWKNHFLLK